MDYTKAIDFSSLDCFLSCERKFLFQYILNLRINTPNIDLTFGSCWHYGHEVVYNDLMNKKDHTILSATKRSVDAFNLLWILTSKHFNPDTCFPKNPGHAADMFHSYWKQYLSTDQKKHIIGIELPFNIVLDEELPRYIGRLDLATFDNDIFEIFDHKTSKYDSPIIFAGFDSTLQSDGYLTAGNLYFDKIPRITYNLAVVQKSKIAFHRYTLMKTKAAIDRFIEDLIHHIKNILHNIDIYNNECNITDRNYNPKSFKRKGGYACTMYFRKCAYFDICHMRNNPFAWKDKPPQGYVTYEWDPKKHETEMKNLLENAKVKGE